MSDECEGVATLLDLRETILALEDAFIAINKLLSVICVSPESKSEWNRLGFYDDDPIAEYVNNLVNNGIEQLVFDNNGGPF